MLIVNKADVDFLVTENMVAEVDTVMKRDFPRIRQFVDGLEAKKIEHLYFAACGSPLCACQTAEMLLARCSDIPCRVYNAADFVDNPPLALGAKTAVVVISDSGQTEEVAAAVRTARDKNAVTLAFTKHATGNAVAAAAEHVIAYEAECIWEVHLLLTYALALEWIRRRPRTAEVEADISCIERDLERLPAVLAHLVKTTEEQSKRWGIRASQWPFIYTLASGALVPLGYKEGIITMQEFTWTHGCFLNAAEFRHGPLEVVGEDVPYVVLLGSDASRSTAERALRFIKKRTDNVIVFDVNAYAPGFHPLLAPFLLFVPLEYFYYYLSLAKGHNPDHRRYYGGLAEY